MDGLVRPFDLFPFPSHDLLGRSCLNGLIVATVDTDVVALEKHLKAVFSVL